MGSSIRTSQSQSVMRAFSSWFMVRIGRIECSSEYNILQDAIDVLKTNSRTRAL